MVDPVRYYTSATELDLFLDTSCSNFDSDGHLVPPSGPDQVKYAISHLNAWSNHRYPALRQKLMTDHSEWAGNFSAEFSTCVQEFDLFSQAVAKDYGD